MNAAKAEAKTGFRHDVAASAAQAGHVMGTTNYCEAVDGFLPVGLHFHRNVQAVPNAIHAVSMGGAPFR